MALVFTPLRILAVLLAFGSVAAAEDAGPHPRLLLDDAGVKALKQRIAGPLAEQWKHYRADVNAELLKPVELPPRGGNWSHYYVCPIHAARLTRGKQIGPWQWEHICPVGPHVLRGDPSKAATDFDGNAIAEIHLDLADETVRMGIAYQASGDEKYAKRSREILMAYADKYQQYPLRKEVAGSGHLHYGALTEASWMIFFAQGVDLVWPALSAEDRKAIEEKVLRPALDDVILNIIRGGGRRLGNHQVRADGAIGLVGFLLNDQKLIKLALDEPVTGFRAAVEKGVLDDGMWFEGSSGYHFYTLDAMWPLAEAARHAGIDLYTPRFKGMFYAPNLVAMPDFVMPALNDGQDADMVNKTDLNELAYARWHDPIFAAEAALGHRTGRLALLFGEPFPSNNDLPPDVSHPRNLTSSGYAILQKNALADATWLLLKYGPHGSGHGHCDKNEFILWRQGQVIMPDAGTHAYGSPVHGGWDKMSLAHNTLTVDEQRQDEATGKSLAFGSSGGVDYAMTDAGPIYKKAKVRFIRTVAMIDPAHVVIVDQIHASASHTFDLAAHVNGKWDSLPDGQAFAAPKTGGFALLQDLTTRNVHAPLSLRSNLDSNNSTTIALAGDEPTEIITGTGPGASTMDRVPVAIFRRRAQATMYAWCVSMDGTTPTLEILPVRDANGHAMDSADAVGIRITGAGREINLLVDPGGKPVSTDIGGKRFDSYKPIKISDSASVK